MNMKGAGRYIGVWLGCALLGATIFGALITWQPAQAATLTPEERAKLQSEYDQLQQEIAQWQKVLDETKAKKNTLQGDVTALDAQIKKAQAEINQRNITIRTLGGQIQQKTKIVETLEQRLEKGRESLAKMLREKNELETTPLAVLVLSSGSLSDLMSDVDAIDSVNQNLQDLFAELRGVKKQTEEEKAALARQQDAQLDAKHEIEVKKEQINEDKKEKDELLNITKKDEANYRKVLAERQQKAAEIHARLFPLRDTEAIQFGDAVAYAKTAAAKTGVRAELILAILSQESSLGTNVGNCFVTNLSTGDGKNKNSGASIAKVMYARTDTKRPSDTIPFERITAALGKDWRTTPVSCPQASGYGGAMGPTQFIPSTWAGYESQIEAALGVDATNPWNAGHAIMATGLYLADAGAGAQTYTAERNAACRYFSGNKCPSSGWIANYAKSVIAKAEAYKKDIEALADL